MRRLQSPCISRWGQPDIEINKALSLAINAQHYASQNGRCSQHTLPHSPRRAAAAAATILPAAASTMTLLLRNAMILRSFAWAAKRPPDCTRGPSSALIRQISRLSQVDQKSCTACRVFPPINGHLFPGKRNTNRFICWAARTVLRLLCDYPCPSLQKDHTTARSHCLLFLARYDNPHLK